MKIKLTVLIAKFTARPKADSADVDFVRASARVWTRIVQNMQPYHKFSFLLYFSLFYVRESS